jgi:hypothetical protein
MKKYSHILIYFIINITFILACNDIDACNDGLEGQCWFSDDGCECNDGEGAQEYYNDNGLSCGCSVDNLINESGCCNNGGIDDSDLGEKDCSGDCSGTLEVDCSGACDGAIGCYQQDCLTYPANLYSCSGTCIQAIDECGVCGGDNSTCTDCSGNVNPCGNGSSSCLDWAYLDPFFGTENCNENECVGGMTEKEPCPPPDFFWNSSADSATYNIQDTAINGYYIDSDDWIGVFNGDVCVGATNQCDFGCEIYVMGFVNPEPSNPIT